MTTTTQQQLISNNRRLDMLTGALEGGSNYWYEIKEDACNIIDSVKPSDKQTPFVDRMWAAILGGKAIQVHDVETEELLGEISLDTMTEREYTMLEKQPTHFADILSEDDDACTADVWFQFVVMNELVYG